MSNTAKEVREVSLSEALTTVLEALQSLLFYSSGAESNVTASKDVEKILDRLWLYGLKDE